MLVRKMNILFYTTHYFSEASCSGAALALPPPHNPSGTLCCDASHSGAARALLPTPLPLPCVVTVPADGFFPLLLSPPSLFPPLQSQTPCTA